MQYPAATLSFQKNKYYVVVTIPEELRAEFPGRKQLKRSTGTSDKRQAEQRKHDKTTELYRMLDEAGRTKSPIYIALKNYIEEIGDGGLMNLESKDLSNPHVIEDILFQFNRSAQIAMYSGDDNSMHQAQLRIEPAYTDIEHLIQARRSEITLKTEKRFSDAAQDYLARKSWGREKTKKAAQLAWRDFQAAVGNLQLSKITKQIGYSYADELAKKSANKTIRNRVGFVSQVLSHSERKGWIVRNPLENLDLKGYGTRSERYQSLTSDQLHQLFAQEMPEDVYLLLSVLVSTGMRLDEAATLSYHDLKTEDGIQFFDLTSNDKVIKNMGSARKVPLIPEIAIRIGTGVGRVFPRFKLDADGKAQAAASKACMNYIRKASKDRNVVVHSLRATLKDKLRDTGVSKEINDFITGHGSGDVAGSYGDGPSLKARYDALCTVDHQWFKKKD